MSYIRAAVFDDEDARYFGCKLNTVADSKLQWEIYLVHDYQ